MYDNICKTEVEIPPLIKALSVQNILYVKKAENNSI